MSETPTDRALAEITALLRQAGIPDPGREARLLLAHDLGLTPSQLITRATVPETAARTLAARRAAREPLAYLTGHREFWSLDLAVTPATLIPRPDSETLIEAALHHRPDRSAIRTILDLGTGTGALLLAGLTEYPDAFGIGTDRSPAATRLAQSNAVRLGLAARAAFLTADWATPLAGRFDLILANPPYIPTADIAALMPEVATFEPRSALDGGPDGLIGYRTIIAGLPRLLAPGGLAILEAGIGQAGPIAALAHANHLAATPFADLAGVDRAIVLTAE